MLVVCTMLSTLGMVNVALDTSRRPKTDVLFLSFWVLTIIFAAWLIVQCTRRSTPQGEPTPPRRILSIAVRVVPLSIVLAMLGPSFPHRVA